MTWIFITGKLKEAQDALILYRSSDSEAVKEFKDIVDSTRQSEESETSLRELVSFPYATPLLTSLLLLLAQQTTGITGITIHAVKIFENLGTSVDPASCTVVIAIVNIITTFIAAKVHARYNRKPVFLVFSVLLVTIELLIGTFFWAKSGTGWYNSVADSYGFIALVLILLFYVVFGLSLGPMPFMYMSEGLPSKIRGPGSALAVTFNMLAVFIVLQGFSPLVDVLGYHYSLISFAVVTAVAVAVIHSLMIETKGRSITEIDEYYEKLRRLK